MDRLSYTHQIKVPAVEDRLAEVRDFITKVCDEAAFLPRETANTKLAVDEACTNIVKHAYKDGPGEIDIRVEVELGRVRIIIKDEGEGFDWESVQTPDLNEYVEVGKKGGLGIFLINRLMDDVSYAAGELGNELFLEKYSAEYSAHRFNFPIAPSWTYSLRVRHSIRAMAIFLAGILATTFFVLRQQTIQVQSERTQAWMQMKIVARYLGKESVDLLVKADPFSVERASITATIRRILGDNSSILYASVVGNDSTIYADSDIDKIFQRFSPPDGTNVLTDSDGVQWSTLTLADGRSARDIKVPVGVRDGPSGRWNRLGEVHLGVSSDQLEAAIDDPRLITAIYLVLAFLMGSVIILVMVNFMVKPIQSLTEGIRRIGEGSLEARIEVEGPAEINAIAEAFNEITAKFRNAQSKVVEQERFQKEMQVAQEIQQTLLPKKNPELSGYDLGAMYKAAKEVGGDYYDFITVGEDALGVVVADVSGKGVPGSLVMTMIRTALRMEARGNLSARDVMAKMNQFVTDDMRRGMFVTMFYVILDSRNRVISYASAGHNPMILYRANEGQIYFLNPKGIPVGINLPDVALFEKSMDVEKIRLKQDDMLLIYTDGITEAMNSRRELYGEERLLEAIKRFGHLHPEEFVRELDHDIRDFTGGMAQNDDITVVAIKEKLRADEVLSDLRSQLIRLVDVEGLSVIEACRRMRVSTSTYYRYKRRYEQMGERGLRNKVLRDDERLARLSVEERNQILDIVRRDPTIGPARMAHEINLGKDPGSRVKPNQVYDELKRLRLNNQRLRLDYVQRLGRTPALPPGNDHAPEDGPVPATADDSFQRYEGSAARPASEPERGDEISAEEVSPAGSVRPADGSEDT